jgi:AraC family transcriptional regulator
MLGNVGHASVSSPAYNWHGHKRGRAEFTLLQYTLNGRGRLRIGEKEQDVKPGTAMLLHFPDDNHYWLPADSASWEFIYVCLHGREVSRLWRSMEHALGSLVTLEPDSQIVQHAGRIVATALQGQLLNAYGASALAYELLMLLSTEALDPRTNPQAQPGLENARLYAETNFAQPLTVDDLARRAGMSRYHFSRLFAAHTGLPPAAWLVEQRVKETARLLRSTKLPLKEIASRCGFPNENYLSRVFRKQTGIPPATYRRSGT